MRIFDYPLAVMQREMIHTHRDAKALKVVVKGGVPHLYMIVDEEQPVEPLFIRTVCAGEECNLNDAAYVDTFVIDDWFVGHVFLQEPGSFDPVSDRYADDFREVRKSARMEP